MSLVRELKRRNVIRMAGLVGGWPLAQVAGTILPMFGAGAFALIPVLDIIVRRSLGGPCLSFQRRLGFQQRRWSSSSGFDLELTQEQELGSSLRCTDEPEGFAA